MKMKSSILFLFVFFLLVGLTACAQPVEEPLQQPQEVAHEYPEPFYDPEDVAAEVEALESGEPVEVEEVAEPEPEVEEPTDDQEADQEDDVAAEPAVDSCIECHTDKDALIATAKPEVEVETENEGEG